MQDPVYRYSAGMKRLPLLVCLLLGCWAQSEAHAKMSLSSASIEPFCRAEGRSYEKGLCLGLILGVEDNASFDHKICVPPTTTNDTRIKTILLYIKRQSHRDEESFASLAFDALHERWPCRSP